VSSDAPLRIGIIGSGFMGAQHAQFVSDEPLTVLTAIADPFNTAVASDFGVAHFMDYRDMLASGLVDAVMIVNPNALHVETALACLEAGIPALLEKPVAVSPEDAKPLLAAVAASQTPILVGHHRRHHPAVAAARNAIAEGQLGELVAINGMWITRKSEAYFADVEWHRHTGAGVILINLVHDLDLLRYLVGEIVSVQAAVSSATRNLEVEDTASVVVRFANGALGSFLASDAAVSPYTWDQSVKDDTSFPFNEDSFAYVLAGTRASLTFPRLTVHGYASDEPKPDWNHELSSSELAQAEGHSYANQLRHFVRVARGQEEPIVTVEDAVRTLTVLEAVTASSETGATVIISQ